MENNLEFLADFKSAYDCIEIPSTLDEVILTGINDGKKLKKHKSHIRTGLRSCASIVVVFAVLTLSINIFPTFAGYLKEIPIVGQLVEVLTFVEGKSTGGKITDGMDIQEMEGVETAEGEEIVIHVGAGASYEDVAGRYNIRYRENPAVLSFDIGGARRISATEDFETIANLGLVKEVYRLMTLDDSLIRFNIVFNEPIAFEIEEYQTPATLRLLVKPKHDDSEMLEDTIYAVRSESYSYNESFGHLKEELIWPYDMEESFISSEELRILRDDEENYCFEFGQFKTSEEAQNYLKTIEEKCPIPLMIEERLANDLPKGMLIETE